MPQGGRSDLPGGFLDSSHCVIFPGGLTGCTELGLVSEREGRAPFCLLHGVLQGGTNGQDELQ